MDFEVWPRVVGSNLSRLLSRLDVQEGLCSHCKFLMMETSPYFDDGEVNTTRHVDKRMEGVLFKSFWNFSASLRSALMKFCSYKGAHFRRSKHYIDKWWGLVTNTPAGSIWEIKLCKTDFHFVSKSKTRIYQTFWELGRNMVSKIPVRYLWVC